MRVNIGNLEISTLCNIAENKFENLKCIPTDLTVAKQAKEIETMHWSKKKKRNQRYWMNYRSKWERSKGKRTTLYMRKEHLVHGCNAVIFRDDGLVVVLS